jgi:hypothetical protein
MLILVMIFMFHNLRSLAQTAPPKNVSAFQPVVPEKNVVREWAAPELEFIHFPNEALEPPSPNRWGRRLPEELRQGTSLTPNEVRWTPELEYTYPTTDITLYIRADWVRLTPTQPKQKDILWLRRIGRFWKTRL